MSFKVKLKNYPIDSPVFENLMDAQKWAVSLIGFSLRTNEDVIYETDSDIGQQCGTLKPLWEERRFSGQFYEIDLSY